MQTVTFVTVVLIFVGLALFTIFKPTTEETFDYSKHPSIGSANAPVKVMEFGDFKCPYCKNFHDQIYPQLKKDFIDTGKVQMFFTNYEFIGPDSMTAAIAGESIYKQNNDAFWKYYDAIYANQGKEDQIWATPEFLIDLVKKNVSGVDVNKLSEDLKNKTYEKDVLADNEIARNSKITEIPTIFVNGKKVEGSMDYSKLKKAIEEALKKK
jgi:protein-disulfide isomerase